MFSHFLFSFLFFLFFLFSFPFFSLFSFLISLFFSFFSSLFSFFSLLLLKKRHGNRNQEKSLDLDSKSSLGIAGRIGKENLKNNHAKENLKDNLAKEDQDQESKLEIDCQRLILQEILGEGAFGQVKRGLYQMDATSSKMVEVAVKMLKRK